MGRLANHVYFDLETGVDKAIQDRWNLPTLQPMSELFEPVSFATDTIASAKNYVKEVGLLSIPPEWFQALLVAEQAGKDRGAIIELAYTGLAARAQKTARYALDPELCTIDSIAWAFNEGGVYHTLGRNGNEAVAIKMAWEVLGTIGYIPVGYRIIEFDIKVLLSRSMQHGILPSRRFDLRPFGNQDIIDLMILRFGREKAKGLKQWATELGVDIPAGDVSGGDVSGLSDEELLIYGDSDIQVTRAVHEMGAGYYWDKVYGEVPKLF